MSQKDAKRGSRQPGSLPLPRFLAIMSMSALATLAAVLALVALIGGWLYAGPGPAARQDGSTTVILRQGAGLPEIAASLARAGVVRSATIFIAATQITRTGRHLKAGEYEFPSGASMYAHSTPGTLKTASSADCTEVMSRPIRAGSTDLASAEAITSPCAAKSASICTDSCLSSTQYRTATTSNAHTS